MFLLKDCNANIETNRTEFEYGVGLSYRRAIDHCVSMHSGCNWCCRGVCNRATRTKIWLLHSRHSHVLRNFLLFAKHISELPIKNLFLLPALVPPGCSYCATGLFAGRNQAVYVRSRQHESRSSECARRMATSGATMHSSSQTSPRIPFA